MGETLREVKNSYGSSLKLCEAAPKPTYQQIFFVWFPNKETTLKDMSG